MTGKKENVLKSDNSLDQAIKDGAFRLLSYRLRSQRELVRRLTGKGFAEERVERVIRELVEKGYVNDRKFARAFVRDQVRLRNLGPLTVRNKLREFGLDPELIESTLAEVYAEFPEQELIHYWSAKKGFPPVSGTITPKDRQKFIAFLKRKGFGWDQIQRFMKEDAEKSNDEL